MTNSARTQVRARAAAGRTGTAWKLPVRWELLLLVGILALAAVLRFWDLGARTFHGDEAINSGFAWQLADGRGYIHNPLTHGPFQFLGTALIFVLFGDSDYTARVLPALFGTGLVALPFLLRGHLGRAGALVAALLLAVSPTLLYFSRFAREDIYLAFFTLSMFVCVWRYLQKPRRLYLYLIAALLALTFATKEVAYIIVAMLLVYLDLLAAQELASQVLSDPSDRLSKAVPEATTEPDHYALLGLPQDASVKAIRRAYKRLAKEHRRDGTQSIDQAFAVLSDAGKRRSYDRRLARSQDVEESVSIHESTGLRAQVRQIAVYAALLPSAVVLLPFWPLLGSLRRRWRLEVFPRAGHLMMLVACLSLPLFAAAVQKLPFVGDRAATNPAAEVPVMHATVLTLMAISLVFGFLWRRQVWLACAAIFWAIFILLFTSFFTNANGFWSGTWGSLDYWLGQQGVHLGDQPGYYYFMLLPIYEFLPLVFALGTVLFYTLRGKRSQQLIAVAALAVVIALAVVGGQVPLIGPYRTEAGFVTIIAAML
ncbi:MAG: flippase activity-associated protein Agl23, partial [Ktedonobacterales bacterium]